MVKGLELKGLDIMPFMKWIDSPQGVRQPLKGSQVGVNDYARYKILYICFSVEI